MTAGSADLLARMVISKRRDLPPELAPSYEQLCRRAAQEEAQCKTVSWWGWNTLIIVAMAPPGLIGLFFFISLTDPDPSWGQWVAAFGFSGLATWLFSFPMRAAGWALPRGEELGVMWLIWYEWVNGERVPRYDFQVDGFTGPGGEPSASWRIWPDGDESKLRKPLPPEWASTVEQFRCRLTYELILRLTRPFFGARGGNFMAWVGSLVGLVLTIDFALELTSADPAPWAGAKLAGFAVFTLLMASFPVRAARRDFPRFRKLRRQLLKLEVEYEGDLRPPPPGPGPYPFNADLY